MAWESHKAYTITIIKINSRKIKLKNNSTIMAKNIFAQKSCKNFRSLFEGLNDLRRIRNFDKVTFRSCRKSKSLSEKVLFIEIRHSTQKLQQFEVAQRKLQHQRKNYVFLQLRRSNSYIQHIVSILLHQIII